MFRLQTLATVLMVAIPTSVHAQARSTWVYEDNGGGYFEADGGGAWTEVTATANFRFQEVERTRDYVQMHDASRKISVRIYASHLYIRYPGSGGWQFRYNGHWQ
jgi:hypothetical protein